MRIRYTETALIEIDDIFAYIAKRNRSAAFAVVDRARDLIAGLADFPLMGVVADEAGVRMLPVVRYPYLIFYTVEADEVVILHVRHAARQRPWEGEP